MWNHKKLIKTFENEACTIEWSKNNGLLPQNKYCKGIKYKEHGQTTMKFQNSGKYGRFYCSKCRRTQSLLHGSWFAQIHTPMTKIFRYKFSREMIVDWYCLKERERGKIGGHGKVVQVV
uniref:Uncharacterized protein n=1 Tax=Meloidogyne hapla TaxID=6305 RepID=A0A1I8BBR7_MELHA